MSRSISIKLLTDMIVRLNVWISLPPSGDQLRTKRNVDSSTGITLHCPVVSGIGLMNGWQLSPQKLDLMLSNGTIILIDLCFVRSFIQRVAYYS